MVMSSNFRCYPRRSRRVSGRFKDGATASRQTTPPVAPPNSPRDTPLHLIQYSGKILKVALEVVKKSADGGVQAIVEKVEGVELEHETARAAGEPVWVGAPKPAPVHHLVSLQVADFPNLVVGLACDESSFGSDCRLSEVPNAVATGDTKYKWPLRQLAHACHRANTRYGYLALRNGILACCFTLSPAAGPARRGGRLGNDWQVSMKPVMWSQSGDKQLTADLTLWWMSMMAISGEHNRKLVPEAERVSINHWDEIQVEGGATVLRHHYSLAEKPA
ncbi:hypothetical protein GGTG_12342 [Gaeumannomyces tritici R3-111a-1]|uniref:Uncharacterized protein n=1 Tax=Gaeumannomyces tritici (strain R3-111a-1) TaxID=644352 RepID=J3PFR7_GAET3|nr:hypothetical protein GGTG_12342 [Gaeumannomyces tritici R3-111a-1]EJT70169.1 hypothetical protein GGTG_12342 [Gaeumannomyces tritici R3-111a-1]